MLEKDLATYVSRTKFEDLSAEAVYAAKRSTLDTIAAMLAGSNALVTTTIVELQSSLGAAGKAHLVGRPERFSPPVAALCNGVMARAMEIDDCVDFLPVHPSASAVPVLLTLSEIEKNLSGREFLTALAVGQDVIIRMGLTVRENAMESGRNNLFKIFGPTAAVARALNLDSQQTHHALGIAYSCAVGDGQCVLDPDAMTLSLQQGVVAKGALLSGMLAQRGFTGAREFLLGRAGYLVAYEPNHKLAFLTEGLGHEFYGEQITIKPFSSCRATHPAIDLAMQLSAAHRIDPGDINRITLRANPEVCNLVAVPHESKIRPTSMFDAQFSVQFTVAAALIRKDMFLNELAPAVLSNTHILDLASRVRVLSDESLRTDGVLGRTKMQIDVVDGNHITGEIAFPLGNPKRPMTFSDCSEKLKKCAAHALLPLGRKSLETLIDRIDEMEDMEDVSTLFDSLCGE
ncbi:MAG: MmgE/PrpD family protein [Deltaproteobacteria bacterium]|nr:MmgE/PrpD family protein [Deltaproteobacteria bacterium]